MSAKHRLWLAGFLNSVVVLLLPLTTMGCATNDPEPRVISKRVLADDLRLRIESLEMRANDCLVVIDLLNVGKKPILVEKHFLGHQLSDGIRLWRAHSRDAFAMCPNFGHGDGYLGGPLPGIMIEPGETHRFEDKWPMTGGYYLRMLPNGEVDTNDETSRLPPGGYAVDIVGRVFVKRAANGDYRPEFTLTVQKAWLRID